MNAKRLALTARQTHASAARSLRWLGLAAISSALVATCSTSTPKDEPATPDNAPRIHGDCRVPPRPPAAIELVPIFSDLEIDAPIALVQAPALPGEASGRFFAADQHGVIHAFHASAAGEVTQQTSTDITARVHTASDRLDERGLLGLAVYPTYTDQQRLVVSYTAAGNVSTISRFDVTDGRVDPDSEAILLQAQQPFSNHNGGHVAFGKDGLLYIGLGDGGNGGDPEGNGQNRDTLLGSILRIDVAKPAGGRPYSIPPDNPFADGDGAPEIFAWGLRNPWRFSFDRDTGELWVGDVGQDEWEEISIVGLGGNYGWNEREGFECYPPGDDCELEGKIDPVHAYGHPDNRSVTGGFVYRGTQIPDLVGSYIFADYVTGEIWKLIKQGTTYSPGTSHESELLSASAVNVSSFAEDLSGELYVLDYGGGRILQLRPGAMGGDALPALLSDTGCVASADPSKLVSAAVPYDVVVPFWSDGLRKERFVLVPDGSQLSQNADGEYELPPGGMTIKNFYLDKHLFETRFFVRHADGEYSGFSYAWREDGKDAELVVEDRKARVGDIEWTFPGRVACGRCHTAAAGHTLGLEPHQLPEDSLERLIQAEILAPPASVERLPDTNDESVALEQRARAYLDVNCSNCHRPGGPGRGGLDLRWKTPLSSTGLCEPANLDDLGTSDGLLLAPGSASDSVLYRRTTRRDDLGMPPLASSEVDEEGTDLLGAWIDSMTACP